MELKVNRRYLQIIVLSTILAGCTKVDDFFAGDDVNQRFRQSMEWNKSHSQYEIDLQVDSYTILAAADSHVGGTNNLGTFLNIAKTTNASAVVMAGDLTSGRMEDYDKFENQLALIDYKPCFLMVGNHDLWSDGWHEFYSRFGSSSYMFTVNTPSAADLFICFDTGSGSVGEDQLEWLTNILLTLRPRFRHCLVFTHNNIFRVNHTLNSNLQIEEIDFLLDLFANNNVEMVITGHDHNRDATLFGVTTYIQIGALKDEVNNANYLKLRVNENLAYEFVNIQN